MMGYPRIVIGGCPGSLVTLRARHPGFLRLLFPLALPFVVLFFLGISFSLMGGIRTGLFFSVWVGLGLLFVLGGVLGRGTFFMGYSWEGSCSGSRLFVSFFFIALGSFSGGGFGVFSFGVGGFFFSWVFEGAFIELLGFFPIFFF